MKSKFVRPLIWVSLLGLCVGIGWYSGTTEKEDGLANHDSGKSVKERLKEKSAELDKRYETLFEDLKGEVLQSREELDSFVRVTSRVNGEETPQPLQAAGTTTPAGEIQAYREAKTRYENSLLTLKIAEDSYAREKVNLYTIAR